MEPIDNGGITDKYKWSQNFNDVTLILPIKISSIKDIKVYFTYNSVLVKLKDEILIRGLLSEEIKKDSSMWYVENNNFILELDKRIKKQWWKSVFKGEKEIDISKVKENDILICDLDPETKSNFDKLQYNIKETGIKLGMNR